MINDTRSFMLPLLYTSHERNLWNDNIVVCVHIHVRCIAYTWSKTLWRKVFFDVEVSLHLLVTRNSKQRFPSIHFQPQSTHIYGVHYFIIFIKYFVPRLLGLSEFSDVFSFSDI